MNKKILVADDESHILSVVSLKLRNAGYDVITARDGAEGLRAAREERPDLIITDYHMPNLSGLEMCQQLRGEGNNTPALMLSARGYDLSPEELHAGGIRQMITKPFSPRQLLTAVNEMLNAA
jgi:two-component system alkaline phosphatase synthesis response regulator PhoP